MQKDDKIRLSHMLSAAREARSFARNETRASIDKDRKLTLALVKADLPPLISELENILESK